MRFHSCNCQRPARIRSARFRAMVILVPWLLDSEESLRNLSGNYLDTHRPGVPVPMFCDSSTGGRRSLCQFARRYAGSILSSGPS